MCIILSLSYFDAGCGYKLLNSKGIKKGSQILRSLITYQPNIVSGFFTFGICETPY